MAAFMRRLSGGVQKTATANERAGKRVSIIVPGFVEEDEEEEDQEGDESLPARPTSAERASASRCSTMAHGGGSRVLSEVLRELLELKSGQERLEGKLDVVQKEVVHLGGLHSVLEQVDHAGPPRPPRVRASQRCRPTELQTTPDEEGGGNESVSSSLLRASGRCSPKLLPAQRQSGPPASDLQAQLLETPPPTPVGNSASAASERLKKRRSRAPRVSAEVGLLLRPEFLMPATSADDSPSKLKRKGTRVGGTSFFNDDGGQASAAGAARALHPEGIKKLAVELLAVVVLQFDLCLVPYALAWGLPLEGPLRIAAWAAAGFWLVDLALGFFTGFYRKGELELRRRNICRHYLRTTFFSSLLLLACDVASLALGGVAGWARLLRVADLARIFRLRAVFAALLRRSLSDGLILLIEGLQLLYGMLWINHVLTCAWYAMALRVPSDTGERWFDSLAVPGGDPHQFERSSAYYQYLTSFHFSIAQLFAGGLEGVSPLSSPERLFNIFCLVFGMLFVSTLVGALSTTMMQIKMRNEESAGKLRELRHFLSEKSISAETAVRVQKQVIERMSKKRRLTDRDVPALELLSSGLRWELRFEIFGPQVVGYPLLRLCHSLAPDLVRRLCGEALDTKELSPGDVLFEAGTFANSMYLLSAGSLKYTYRPFEQPVEGDEEEEEGEEEQDVVETVREGQWLCEVALWTQWSHLGTAHTPASKACELLALSATKSLSILLRHNLVRDVLSEYARQFQKRVVAQVCPTSPVTDIRVPCASYDELIFAMSHETRRVIGGAVLAEMRARGQADTKKIARLKHEVDDGRSCVMLNSDGEVERAVAVTALQLKDSNGHLLVNVGSLLDDAVVPVCQLPGVKQRGSESPDEAIKRLLNDLSPLVPSVRIEGSEMQRSVDLKNSPTSGIPTKYLRTVVTASLEEPFQALQVQQMTASCDEEKDADPKRPKFTVYKIQEGHCANNAYAWMPPSEFNYLSSLHGKAALREWISSLSDKRGSSRRWSADARPGRASLASVAPANTSGGGGQNTAWSEDALVPADSSAVSGEGQQPAGEVGSGSSGPRGSGEILPTGPMAEDAHVPADPVASGEGKHVARLVIPFSPIRSEGNDRPCGPEEVLPPSSMAAEPMAPWYEPVALPLGQAQSSIDPFFPSPFPFTLPCLR